MVLFKNTSFGEISQAGISGQSKKKEMFSQRSNKP